MNGVRRLETKLDGTVPWVPSGRRSRPGMTTFVVSCSSAPWPGAWQLPQSCWRWGWGTICRIWSFWWRVALYPPFVFGITSAWLLFASYRDVREARRNDEVAFGVRSMGLDIIDIIFRVERHFGVKVSRDQWFKMAILNEPPDIKVGQLFDFIRAQVPQSGVLDLDVDASIVWPLYQQQLAEALGVRLTDIIKDKGLIHDLGAG